MSNPQSISAINSNHSAINPLHLPTSLYVGDLAPETTEAHLFEIFNQAGTVTSIRICKDSSAVSLGYGYVNYHNHVDAERAMDTLNFSPICGRAVRIMWCQRDPRMRKSGTGNVFVKDLSKDVDSKSLHDLFSVCGNILSCKVECTPDGESKGFGFVNFDSQESADKAIQEMNGMKFRGTEIYVGPFKKKSDRPPSSPAKYTNVYVKNFPESWSAEDLISLFAEYGEITSKLIKEDSKGRRFAFINFESSDSAREAVEGLNGKKVVPDEPSSSSTANNIGGNIIGNNDNTNDNNNVGNNENYINALANATNDENNNENGDTHNVSDHHSSNGMNNVTKSDENSNVADSALPAGGGVGTSTTSGNLISTATSTATGGATSSSNSSVHPSGLPTTRDGGDTHSSVDSVTTIDFENDPTRLYVVPHQPRSQRTALLKAKHEEMNGELRNNSKPTSCNIYIKNLDESIDNEQLRQMFEVFGPISSVKVMKNQQDQPLGFGFVTFVSHEDGIRAISDMHYNTPGGKPLYVALHEPKERRKQRLKVEYGGSSVGRQSLANENNSAGSAVLQNMQFHPSQVPYSQQPNMGGFAPRSLMQFNPNMISWRNQPPTAFNQQGGAMRSHPQGVHTTPIGMFAGMHSTMNPAAAVQNPVQIVGLNRGAAGAGVQQRGVSGRVSTTSLPPQAPPVKAMPYPKAQQMGGTFKFTPQVRNQMEPQNQHAPPQLHENVPSSNPEILTTAMLSGMTPTMQKQALGEKLYPRIAKYRSDWAGKITGMMLEMENEELLMLLNYDQQLKIKVDEAVRVLDQHQHNVL